jgi:hypothetical protein
LAFLPRAQPLQMPSCSTRSFGTLITIFPTVGRAL